MVDKCFHKRAKDSEKSPVSLGKEENSTKKTTKPPSKLNPPTPPSLEIPPQPGCFILAAPKELKIPSYLIGAVTPHHENYISSDTMWNSLVFPI